MAVRVRVDGEEWECSNDETAEYDAIHTAAGAVLAGATEVQVINTDNGEER
ncbi:hypothetical protein [Halostella sp. PRR32]|uniref:hypothetical protein n=1 Tax=Halostella sp. PRR32 TaxID=3098147 RepID=UPI002B1DC462|nr:hypothetical protein [Halostella sp. PRR32]